MGAVAKEKAPPESETPFGGWDIHVAIPLVQPRVTTILKQGNDQLTWGNPLRKKHRNPSACCVVLVIQVSSATL